MNYVYYEQKIKRAKCSNSIASYDFLDYKNFLVNKRKFKNKIN